MHQWRWAASALALALILSSSAQAERVTSRKVPGPPPSTGTKPDITVPYTTNGNTTLGVYNKVEPKVYASPISDDPNYPQAKPVFNLIFYGAVQSFGDRSNGATPRASGVSVPR